MDALDFPPLIKRQRKVSYESSPVVSRSVRKEPIVYKQTKSLPLSPEKLQQHIVLPGSQHHASSVYKMLRTQVLKVMLENHWQTLGVISARAGEGKTLTAVNLAISLSQDEMHTVLLADLNLKKPDLSSYLSRSPICCLEDVLLHDIEVEQALINPMIDGLVMLMSRGGQVNTSEILMSSMMEHLILELRHRYSNRLLIMDLPSVLDSDDVLAVSKHIDAFLIVVADGKSTTTDLHKTLQLLEGENIIGTVLNRHIV